MKLTDIQKKQIEDELPAYTNEYAGKTREERKLKGQFFTPAKLVIRMLEMFDCEEPGDQTILDPTAGNGNLLIGALIAGFKPENVYGNELDPEIYEMLVKRLTKYGVPKENLANMDCLSDDFKGWCGKFDLIIANPPYGKSSSLSKKIVNKMLETKVAKEIVVLAPPKTFQDNLQTIVGKTDIGLTSDHFDIPVANGVKVFICRMVLDKESNESWEHFLLSGKELQYLEAVESYNKDKVYSFETPGWTTTRAKSKGIFKDIDESRIVLFGIYYPKYLSTGWLQSSGEAEEHNLRGKAIRYHDGSSAPWALVFRTQEEAKGFLNFVYRGVEENKAGKLLTFGFSILRKLYGDGPSSKRYRTILPALDWSRPWTDKEILKEIGLPEDFLEMH